MFSCLAIRSRIREVWRRFPQDQVRFSDEAFAICARKVKPLLFKGPVIMDYVVHLGSAECHHLRTHKETDWV